MAGGSDPGLTLVCSGDTGGSRRGDSGYYDGFGRSATNGGRWWSHRLGHALCPVGRGVPSSRAVDTHRLADFDLVVGSATFQGNAICLGTGVDIVYGAVSDQPSSASARMAGAPGLSTAVRGLAGLAGSHIVGKTAIMNCGEWLVGNH